MCLCSAWDYWLKFKLVTHIYNQAVKNPIAELAFMGKASINAKSSIGQIVGHVVVCY